MCLALAVLSGAPSALAESQPDLRSSLWESLLSPSAGRYGALLDRARAVLEHPVPNPGALHRAKRWVDAANRLAPRRPWGWYLLGRIAARLGAWTEAAAAFATTRKVDPAFLPRQVTLRFAMASFRAGRWVDAGQALAGLPRRGDSPLVVARLLTNAAEAYGAAGHLHQAIRLFLRASAVAPSYGPARWGLAVARHRLGQFGLARKVARIALAIDPKGNAILGPTALYAVASDRLYHRALLAEARGRFRAAIALLHAYLGAAPRSPFRAVVRHAIARLSSAPPEHARRAKTGRRAPLHRRGGGT